MASKPNSSKAVASISSPEYLTIRECFSHLVIAVKHSYDTIGDRLFSKGHVSPMVRDFIRMESKMPADKARKLLDAVIDRIKYHPNIFNDFIEVLDKEGPCTTDMVKELHDVYKTKSECVLESSLNQNAEESDCESDGSHSVDSSSENTFYSASELDESIHIDAVSVVAHNVATPSTGDTSATTKTSTKSSNDDAGTQTSNSVQPDSSQATISSVAGFAKAVNSVTEQQPMFPYLDTKMLSEKDRISLVSRLTREVGDMMLLFASFRSSVIKSFESQIPSVKVEIVVDFVRSLGCLAAICPKALAEEDEENLRQAKSIRDIFSALLPYTSFFHYRIIEVLVREFGTQDDKEKLEQYVSAFNRYCKRSVFEVPPNVFHYAKCDDRVFSIKYITEATPSLGNVVVVQEKIAEVLGVNSWALRLCSIKEGCVCLQFCIPSYVADEVLPVSQTQQAALNDIGIRVLEQAEDTQTGEGQSEEPRYI